MADNELFGNSEQLDDTISRAVAIEEVEALADTMSICLSADECRGMRGMKERVLIALNEMPSAQPNLSEAYSKAVFTWLMDYQIRAAELKGRYTPYEVLSWVINDWRKEHG